MCFSSPTSNQRPKMADLFGVRRRSWSKSTVRPSQIYSSSSNPCLPRPNLSLFSVLIQGAEALLQNFLEGLEEASLIPERILLQLGAKYYGIHLGPTALPHVESNPRVTLQPNFYYDQEDVLMAFCEKHGCGWNTTRPSWIPGVAPDAAMNLAYPLIIYACVQKHLGRNLVFPGDLVCWENPTELSSAMTNAYFSEWAVLTDNAKNESFNAMDDSVFTWSGFWPKYAAYFGLASEGPETAAESDFREQVVATPPLPRGWGPPVVNRFRFTLTEWAKDPQVAKAWAEIAEAANLSKKDLGDVDRIFGFADAALLAPWPILYSNEKRRRLGYFGYVDSTESMFQVFKEFVDLGMAPPV
jgi:hypothetical protein